MLFFDENATNELVGMSVDYKKLAKNRQVEADHIAREVSFVEEYMSAFDAGLLLIANGDTEQTIIDAENSW